MNLLNQYHNLPSMNASISKNPSKLYKIGKKSSFLIGKAV